MIGLGLEIDPAICTRAVSAYEGSFTSRLQLRFRCSRTTDAGWIRRHLEQSGALYLWEREQQAERATAHQRWRARKGQIDRVADAADKLQQALKDLDPEAGDHFWRDVRQPMMKLISGDPKVFGDRVVHNAKGQSAPVFLLNEERLTTSVAILENMASDACSRIKIPAGKPRNMALQHWVSQMRILLTSDFGQSFTFSDGPDGPSMALQFCLFAMEPLDGEVSRQEMAWAMRKTIRSLREARAKPSPSLAQTHA